MYNLVILFIFLISQTSTDKVEDRFTDIMNCFSEDNSCSSVSLKTKNLECCKLTIDFENDEDDDDDDTPVCAAVFTNYISDDMKKSVEAMAREEFGVIDYFTGSGISSIGKFSTTYKCKKKSTTFTFGGYTYTDSEIQILKSDDNCFRLYYYSVGDVLGITKKNIAKNDCLKAKILQTTKNANIQCGYSEFTILWSDNTNTHFNTCYYLPKAAVKSKQLDTQTQSFLDQMNSHISTRERKTSKSYKVTITDSNGNVLTYDSATGIVSKENYIKAKISILFILFLVF